MRSRIKIGVAALVATLAICLVVCSIWVFLIGPHDWPDSVPQERNRIHSPAGFSMIVPERWRSGADLWQLGAVSGASDYFSTRIWVERVYPENLQPQPLPENATF